MKTEILTNYEQVIIQLCNNQVVALPAEACFGLSSLPSNDAITQILRLKGRAKSKGLILVAPYLEMFENWVDGSQLTDRHWGKLKARYNKPTTWVVPARNTVESGIRGDFDSIAIRITEHPVLAYLSEKLNSVLISTSANLQGQPPAMTTNEVLGYFDGKISAVFDSKIGSAQAPSQIIDLLSGELIRR
ncbi:Sua5/YciO/YrdC/YwlC family protein [Thiotrichales bacterium 19S3-7]|nr:Sua5/YciO/YrdC/YwlC family protein [Thiotrichales bacterium 19S3-7]MCF6800988.1 Sua5/YciO/YrdC/YwlC family protein [Thiotrichales bacterium 19S3-11]